MFEAFTPSPPKICNALPSFKLTVFPETKLPYPPHTVLTSAPSILTVLFETSPPDEEPPYTKPTVPLMLTVLLFTFLLFGL